MIKTTLLATSAVVFGGSIACAEVGRAPHPRPQLPDGAVVVISKHGVPITIALPSAAGDPVANRSPDFLPAKRAITFSNLNKDRNAQFLSWYGYSLPYSGGSGSSGSNHWVSSSGTRDAISFKGAGGAISTISVPNVGGPFKVAIYTNSPSNTPGHAIVSGYGDGTLSSGYCCTQLVTVRVPKTRLRFDQQYWIVEQGYKGDYRSRPATWLAEDTDYTGDSKALSQTFTYHFFKTSSGRTSTRHYTSPWEGVTSFTEPAAEVR